MNGAPDGFIFVQDMDLGGDGLRVGVKDSIDIEGFATRMGSPCFADAPPAPQHADVVRALLDAGCRIVGKTNMHELAYGVTGINRWTGTPVTRRRNLVRTGSHGGMPVHRATSQRHMNIFGSDPGAAAALVRSAVPLQDFRGAIFASWRDTSARSTAGK